MNIVSPLELVRELDRLANSLLHAARGSSLVTLNMYSLHFSQTCKFKLGNCEFLGISKQAWDNKKFREIICCLSK